MFWVVVCIVPYHNRNFIVHHLEMSELPFDAQGEYAVQVDVA